MGELKTRPQSSHSQVRTRRPLRSREETALVLSEPQSGQADIVPQAPTPDIDPAEQKAIYNFRLWR